MFHLSLLQKKHGFCPRTLCTSVYPSILPSICHHLFKLHPRCFWVWRKKANKKTAEHLAGKRSRSLVEIHTRSFNVETEISRSVVQRGRVRRKRRGGWGGGRKKSLIWEDDGHPSAISPSLSACPTLNAPWCQAFIKCWHVTFRMETSTSSSHSPVPRLFSLLRH